MTTGLRDSAIRGVVFNWSGHIGSLLITFFLTPYLVRTLGNESYGLWSIVMGLSGYYAVSSAGIQGTATRYIAQFESTGQRSKIKLVVSTLVAFYCVLASTTLVVAVCFAWCFPFFFEMAGNSVVTIRAVVLITALNFAIQLVGKPFRATLTAMTRFDLINALNFGSQLLLALMMVAVLRGGGGLLGMAWATLGVGLFAQSIQYWLAAYVLRMKLLSPGFVDRAMAKELVSFSSWLFVSTGAARIRSSSGVIIVGILLGPASAAFFAVGKSLIEKSETVLQGILSVVFPVACQMSAGQRHQELMQIALLVPRVLLSISIMVAIGAVLYGSPLIDLWIEPGYSDHVYGLFCLLAFALIARQISGGHPAILIAQARIRFLALLSSVGAMVVICLGAYLTSRIGLKGIGVALLVVDLVQGIVLSIYACSLLDIRWATFMVRTIFPSVLSSLPTLAAALALKIVIPPINLWMLFVDILIVGAVGATSLFFLCLPAGVRIAILRLLIRKSGGKPVAASARPRSIRTPP